MGEVVTAYEIKTALMWYFRWGRHFICAEEVSLNMGWADVLAYSGKYIYEVEVKITRYDLNNEVKKYKHSAEFRHGANKFYLCVPKYLIEYAHEWIKETNEKYGLIEYRGQYNIRIIKRAKMLHNKFDEDIKDLINRRLSSQVIHFMLKKCEKIDEKRLSKEKKEAVSSRQVTT